MHGNKGKSYDGPAGDDFHWLLTQTEEVQEQYVTENYQEMWAGYNMQKNSGPFGIIMYFVEEMEKKGNDVREMVLNPEAVKKMPDLIFSKSEICEWAQKYANSSYTLEGKYPNKKYATLDDAIAKEGEAR